MACFAYSMVAISRKVSPKDMMYMLLTGEKISAKLAKDYKLINLVTKKTVIKKFMLFQQVIKKSFESIKIGKIAFYSQLEMPLEKAYDYIMVMTKNM